MSGLNISFPGEYGYERENEHGKVRTFSVDLVGSYIEIRRNIDIEFIIECKYRHDSVRWVFAPHDDLVIGATDVCVVLDNYSGDRHVCRKVVSAAAEPFPPAYKGIELSGNKPNPSAIREGFEQLRYSVGPLAGDALLHQIQGLLGEPSPVFMIIPIILTTAELWIMRTDVSLEEIRSASNLSTVAQKVSRLVLVERPGDEVKRHTINAIARNIPQHDLIRVSNTSGRGSYDDFHRYSENFCNRYPGGCLVVNLESLETTLSELISLLTSPDAIVAPTP